MSKVKYIKVSVADRLPEELESVFVLHDKCKWLTSGYVDLSGEWFDMNDDEFETYPTHFLEEVPDREEEMREMLDEYVKAIESETIIIQENEDNEGWENFGGRFYAKAKKLLSELENKP